MSWTLLEPVSTYKRNPGVSLAVRQTKGGERRFVVNLNSRMYSNFKQPEKCEAGYGAGEHAGMIMLRFGEGDHKIAKGHRGDGRLFLPCPADYTQAAGPSASCIVVSSVDHTLIFRLPGTSSPATNDPVATNGGKLVEQYEGKPPIDKPLAPARSARNTEDVDVKRYLRSKGHVFKKLPNGKLTVDGEVKSGVDILNMINGFRNKDNLDRIPYEVLDFDA